MSLFVELAADAAFETDFDVRVSSGVMYEGLHVGKE